MSRLAAGAFVAATLLGSLTPAAIARPVSLSDAAVTPTASKLLAQGEQWTPKACLRPSDVSAYRSNGGALGNQQRIADALTWRGSRAGKRVTYALESRTFTNHTGGHVIVAVWCEA